MKALDLATETAENWIYIQGNYVHEKDNKIEVSEVTDILIASYQSITVEQVNEIARLLFKDNQRRVNFKLCSQNHRAKPEPKTIQPPDVQDSQNQIQDSAPKEEAEEDDEDCLGGPEIKAENEKAVEENKLFYEQMGVK